jgi:hypothetical protein
LVSAGAKALVRNSARVDFGSNLQEFGGYQEENHGFVVQIANLLQGLSIYKPRFCMIL